MLAAAQDTVPGNVDLRQGALEALPIGDAEVDLALLVLVLHHVPDPARALAEAARVLKPGGRLVVVDMLPHDRDDYRQSMGHVWLGFSDVHVSRLLQAARFESPRVVALGSEPAAEGPALFLAAARRPRFLTNDPQGDR
jgi:ArsR family transcriptional regulator